MHLDGDLDWTLLSEFPCLALDALHVVLASSSVGFSVSELTSQDVLMGVEAGLVTHCVLDW